jgi:DNA mismatch repair ATPase MutS
VGAFDALNSLACYSYNNPENVFPALLEEEFRMTASKLGHPLIPPNERISNDLRLDAGNRFMLITGSNMAGKSTFLRTCGINLVLGMAGAPVCAESFEFTPARIYTSMRITDSLLSRESTFYAELKKLKRIITAFREDESAFVLLDEILKGTNSRDKHFGSEMFIRQLIDFNAAGLIATHDLELGRLEEELRGRIKNYCFEVQIEDSQFHYDYKLKEGIARTLNATELMRQMGIDMDKKV